MAVELNQTSSKPSVAVIILAAGYSFRMKRFKPLLPLGSVRAVEKAVYSFQEAGFRDIRVVLGHRANELHPVLEGLGVQRISNDNYADGMFSSVKKGIASLTQEVDGFFLLPVDNPIIQKETLFKLYETFNLGKLGIVYPAFQGERGHPPLISSQYKDKILSWNGDGGLKRLLEYYQEDSVDVETGDPGVLMDMDTPEDYRKMLEYVGCVSLPTEDECYELLRVNNTPAKVIEHCKQVAWLSCFLGRQLVQAGCALNLELLKTAALLHDIAKGKANHAQAGAKIMHKYPQIADIIASHMDITLDSAQALSEKEIVYLADKLVANDQIIPLQERFKVALERHRNEPEIRENVRQRFDNAFVIQARMEQVLKKQIINLCRLELRERRKWIKR